MPQLEEEVVKLLKERRFTLTTAESCTGGMFTSTIVNVSGASEILKQGFIAYCDEAKHKYLDVSSETLQKYTAVSKQTAEEMARGIAIKTNSDVAISITGYAGPYDAEDGTKAGTVYIGCYMKERVTVEKCVFNGNRLEVREQAVHKALELLRRCLLEYKKN